MKSKIPKNVVLPIDWDTSDRTSADEKGKKEPNIRDYGKEHTIWRPDVFVHAFVPEAFSAINLSPALPIDTPAVGGIDFGHYISTFAGSQHLSVTKPPPKLVPNETRLVDSLDHLNARNYGTYFSNCLAIDLQAREPEIQSYNLYGVVLQAIDQVQQIYSLKVPGVREGTPPVSFGDSIMLRQLILDPSTRLPCGMNGWLALGGGFERGEQAPGFTGYQLNAIVLGIDRINEVVFLRAYGVIAPVMPIFNVSFITQARLVESVHRAVTEVAQNLNHRRCSLTDSDTKEASLQGLVERNPGTLEHPVKDLEHIDLDANVDLEDLTSLTPSARSSLQAEGTKRDNLLPTMGLSNTWLQSMLFPQDANGIQQKSLPSVVFLQKWFDASLNYEQKKAVDAVQSENYGTMPYLINGPPGTGKTKTLCELVIQLGKDPEFMGSILLCAPSNPAADTLALRLRAHFDPGSLLRLNHFSRTFAEVPQELLSYCSVEKDLFSLPAMRALMLYKVVVTTCQDADILVQARVTNRDLLALQVQIIQHIHPRRVLSPLPLHWTALVLDEAAQATEPETLIPLSVVTPPAIHVSEAPIFVMAGDQHQLNPRTYATYTTLRISLFERLSTTSMYASHPLARKFLGRSKHELPMLRPPFVHLIRNYRSHPAILAVPSSLFYENTLIPEASQIYSLESWPCWRGRRWPVLFASSAGIDSCEDIGGVGGGWYNIGEAQKAIVYAQDLLARAMVSEQSEICIMSPFKAQVTLLRKLARQSKLWGVNIGPTEAFQGLESRFVILCTTRARKRFLEEDAVRGLGIVNEKKKFNVAITRAKEGLIVLGNPWVLATDPYWLAFLKFCSRNGLWQSENDDSRSTHDFREGNVNDWKPQDAADLDGGGPTEKISGLEAALVYKERDKEGGSEAANRFGVGNESAEDALWRGGLEAQETVDQDDYEAKHASNQIF